MLLHEQLPVIAGANNELSTDVLESPGPEEALLASMSASYCRLAGNP